MPRPKEFSRRVCRFEFLETRNLLAGNVTAGPGSVPGELRILGDAAGNNIQVSQLANGDWKVQGIGTKVNGSNSAQTFSGITQLAVDLLGGNDVIKVANGTLANELDIGAEQGADVITVTNIRAGDIFVDSGAGNDAVTLTGCNSDNRFIIHTGDGSDALAVNNCFAGGDMDFELSDTAADGNDVVHFSRLNANTLLVNDLHGNDTVVGTNSRTAGYMDFNLTSGNDAIAISGLNSGEAILVYVVDGSNVATIHNCTSVGELYIQANGISALGRNVITITDSRSTGEQFSMDLGNGADVVTVNNVTAATDSYLHANGGNNVISINKLNVAGEYTVSSGDGNNVVAIANSTFNQQGTSIVGLGVYTGNGKDVVSIVNVNVTGESIIETGDGTDAVAIQALATQILQVSLDGGKYDSLAITNSSAIQAFFDGGGNTGDTLVKSHNHFTTETDTGFQHVIG